MLMGLQVDPVAAIIQMPVARLSSPPARSARGYRSYLERSLDSFARAEDRMELQTRGLGSD
jgi:hypothetical protein